MFNGRNKVSLKYTVLEQHDGEKMMKECLFLILTEPFLQDLSKAHRCALIHLHLLMSFQLHYNPL